MRPVLIWTSERLTRRPAISAPAAKAIGTSYFKKRSTTLTPTAPQMLVRIAQASMLVAGAMPTKAAEIPELIAPPASTAISEVRKVGCLTSAIVPPSAWPSAIQLFSPCFGAFARTLHPSFGGRTDPLAWSCGHADRRPHPDHGTTRTEKPACRARGRHRDRQGCRSRREHERDPCGHGPERLGQVDARLRTHGPPGLRDHRGRAPARRRGPDPDGGRPAGAEGPLPRVPVSARRSRRDGDELHALGDQRSPQGQGGRGRPDSDPRVPPGADGCDGAAEGPARDGEPLSERGLLRRREEAGRDPSDGDAEAADRGA